MTTTVSPRLSVEAELSNLATELIEVFSEPEADCPDTLDTHQLLKNYIKRVTRCGLAAGRAHSVQLQDHCIQFQTILRSLQSQTAIVVSRYQHVLEQWPLLLMSHLHSDYDDIFIQQLDNLISTTDWPQSPASPEPISSSAMAQGPQTLNQLETSFAPDTETVHEEIHPESSTLLDELNAALADIIGTYTSDEPVSEQQRQSIFKSTADALEVFAMSAAAVGDVALMDITQLFQTSLRKHGEQISTSMQDEWRSISMIITAFVTYLTSSRTPLAIKDLLTGVYQLPFLEPMTASERATFETLFHTNDIPEIVQTTDGTVEPKDTPALDSDNPDDFIGPLPKPRLPTQAHELLQLISAEFEHAISDLSANLSVFLDSTVDPVKGQNAAISYNSSLERFASVFDSIGLISLTKLFTAIHQFLQKPDAITQLNIDQQFWLAEWPAHVLNYLSDPFGYAGELIAHCQSNPSVLALSEPEASQLVLALQQPQIDTGEEEMDPRQTIAAASDVSLQLPDDVNQQLLDSLLQELPQHTADFSSVIGNIVQGKGSLQDVETAQRLAHTLKGAANTVGVAGIANLTHHIEDILLAFTRNKSLPVKPLTNTLQDAADVLEMMSESLLGIGNVSQQQAQAVLQQILDWANQIDLNGLPEASDYTGDPTPEASNVDTTTPTITDPSLRVSAQNVDETLRLIGESIIVNAQLQNGLHRALQQNMAVHSQSGLFQQLAFELEQLIDVRGMNTFFTHTGETPFDALELDQYNELHTLTRRLVEAATDSRELAQFAEDELKNLDGLIHQQKRHHKDTQDVVMKSRMLPVQTIVPRLQRSVRQTCRLTGKDAELQVTGNQTQIDNDILTGLADPLMHVLRNAIDHGIETPELREQLGKSRTGKIDLAFSREGENILIRCQDDGSGLDHAAIRRAAVANGILTKDTELTDEEVARLIFVAGLTTRAETTQMSGRGIGMDAVLTQIARMKGSIKVSSEPQHGTRIEIRLPVTLITLHGIMTFVADQVVAISNRSVEQILYADAGQVVQKGNNLYYNYKDEHYTAYYLEDLLGMARTADVPEETKRPVMLLHTGDGNKVAVLVEKIVATQDVVIKKLGQFIPALPGVEGVTILGDGSVASVIDLNELLLDFQGADYIPQIDHHDLAGIQFGTPKVLVVDDSLSARNSLAEFMQDSGYRVFTARDGIEAIEMLETHLPDVLLVDMEMPRMNGLELTSYVRANPATQNLPIIMITSRGTDKHRREADKAGVNAYLIKPYSESEVLDHIETQLANVFSDNTTLTVNGATS